MLSKIFFPGFVLSYNGVRPNPNRISIIMNFENLKNKQHLQHILGVCNYYRRFVKMHNNYVTPFRDLLAEHTHAFEALKQNFAKAVCLSHVIPGIPFKVQTDASNNGIAGILFQIDMENHHCIISLASRCLTSTETRYTTTELKLLGIVFQSLENF